MLSGRKRCTCATFASSESKIDPRLCNVSVNEFVTVTGNQESNERLFCASRILKETIIYTLTTALSVGDKNNNKINLVTLLDRNILPYFSQSHNSSR